MPKLWKRDDGCHYIRGVLRTEDGEHSTWQVDDARNTFMLLRENGIDTDALPAQFSFTILRRLKRLGWISTEGQHQTKRSVPVKRDGLKNKSEMASDRTARWLNLIKAHISNAAAGFRFGHIGEPARIARVL